MSTSLVRYAPVSDGSLFRRRGLLRGLQRSLDELEREYAQEVEKLRQFERRYRPAVGDRYDELERLRGTINRAWESLGKARAGGTGSETGGEEDVRQAAPSRARPGDEARQLFLGLARQIHPDLASDADERRRRHEVMAEATLAYRDNNARRLQWLLEHWQAESEPILGFGLGSMLSKTNRQIAWMRYRIREMQHSLGQLHASPMARIMEQHEHARTLGRNLILEMRQQIHEELAAAYRDLDRVRTAVEDLEPGLQRAVKAECGL